MQINSKLFPFSFFLSDRQEVDSLEEGAKKYGGATKFADSIYSNIAGSEYIKINNSDNTLSVFIPSTNNVNQKVDNSDMVRYAVNYLRRNFNTDVVYYDTKGSWYSEDLQEVVIEDITIITVNLSEVTATDINLLVKLAGYVKQKMNQEGVSIAINSALAII